VTTVRALSRTSSAAVAVARPADLALIQYTSGSTGDPKGVALTNENLLANMRAIARALALTPEDACVSWLPLYHDMGLIGAWLTALHEGLPIAILSPLAFLARPERWLWAIHHRRATTTVAPNFAYDLVARRIRDEAVEGLDLSSLRATLNGSEPVRPETVERFCARYGPHGYRREAMLPVYGLAETAVALTFPPLGRGARFDGVDRATFEGEGRAVPAAALDGALRFVSCGRALEGSEVRLVARDGSGDDVPERVEGRILFRGRSATQGYFRRPDATADLVRPDGWLDTGDLGYLADGELHVTGRVKDLIIRAGKNLHPREIEEAAESVEGVRRGSVAAFGVADEATGAGGGTGTEAVYVVCETRATDAAERERIAAAVKVAVLAGTGTAADRIVLVPPGSIPKTSSGKVARSECRARLRRGEIGKPHPTVTRQVLGVALGSAPARLAALARRVGGVLFGLRVWLALALSVAVLGVPLLLAPRGRALRRLAVRTQRLFLTLAGLKPAVRGAEHVPDGPAVFVANHTSYLDPVVLAAALPPDARYIAKRELLSVPLVGRVLRHGGHIAVDRSRADLGVAAFAEAAALLAAGTPVVLFPEATFTRPAGLRPFRLGAFRLAVDAGVPVIPVALTGVRRVLPDGDWFPHPAVVTVEVGPPLAVEPAAGGGEKGFAAYVKVRDAAADAIAARIDEPRLDLVAAGPPARPEEK
jgi:1-acyl-sn-glycerol-3-phosphate acyltransferase